MPRKHANASLRDHAGGRRPTALRVHPASARTTETDAEAELLSSVSSQGAAMSLLRQGNESVTVYPEEMVTDSDGNKFSRPSAVGVVVKASVQPLSSTENQDGGFNTTTKYRLRLVNYPAVLGAQSQVEWKGKRYAIEGDAREYNASSRTRHVDYVMVRC